jgi:tetratricopeptide (TPR) repeat protein
MIHVNQGDNALAEGHPSEAIREYNEAQKRRPSKEVGGKLADARKAQRHNDASSLDAHGDAMAKSGRFDEAIDDWMRASQQYSQVARREDLLRKVAKAQSAKRRRRILRLSFGVIILLAVIGVNAYLWTPRGHAWWVERQRQQANSLTDPGARREALSAIIDKNVPFTFYQTFFGRGYAISFARVEADLKTLSGIPEQGGSDTTVADRENTVVKAIETAAIDDQITWPALIKRGEGALKNLSGNDPRARVQAVIDAARAQMTNAEQEIANIDTLRAQGRHDEALKRTEQFSSSFARAGAEWSLPTPGRLDISAPGKATGLTNMVVGVRLVGDKSVFCGAATRPGII